MSLTELSPLQEIERRVQARAKEISLEMATDVGKAKLRALIDDELRAWSADYQRGLRAYDLADPDVVAERAFRNIAGYGPVGSYPVVQCSILLTRDYGGLAPSCCSRGLVGLTAVGGGSSRALYRIGGFACAAARRTTDLRRLHMPVGEPVLFNLTRYRELRDDEV